MTETDLFRSVPEIENFILITNYATYVNYFNPSVRCNHNQIQQPINGTREPRITRPI